MPSLTNHAARDAGAAARAEIRLYLGLLDRRFNELAKAKIAAANLDTQSGGGTDAGRTAATEAIVEIVGLSRAELEAGLNGDTKELVSAVAHPETGEEA